MIEEESDSCKGDTEGTGDSGGSIDTKSSSSAVLNKDVDPSSYRYEGDKCFYTDATSGTEYEWEEEKKEWIVRSSSTNFDSKDYKFDGETYYYTDTNTNITYKWDKEKNEWKSESKNGSEDKKTSGVSSDEEEFDEGQKKEFKRQDMSQGTYGYDGDSHTYTDSKDGTVYVWDRDKNAWFPKVDDDFIARYQMSYGFNTEDQQDQPVAQETLVETQQKQPAVSEPVKRKQDPTWFEVDEKSNTKVYVSNLPLDMTEQEFVDLMQKCGLVMKEIDTQKFKIKMYVDPETKAFKGDALCTYIKVESVNLALNILDGYEVKGNKISVERAKFQMKGNSYDPNLKPKKKSRKQIDKIRKAQEKLFDWRPDKMRGERGKNERVVIIKNLFEPSIFDKDVGLILEYQQDLREEAAKCGNVKKVVIFDRHTEGVAQIIFKEAEAADACIQLLNNRWFGQRKISAQTWDGKTKYTVAETEEQKEERLKKWEKFIQEEDSAKKKQKLDEITQSDEDTRSSAGSNDDTDDENTPSAGNKTTDESSAGDIKVDNKSDDSKSISESVDS